MINTVDYKYRFIKPDETHKVSDLVLRIFHESVAPTYTQKGINTFCNMLSVDFFKILTPEQFTIIAHEDDEIIGVISVINKSHIALLFVETECQKRGIGRGLIQKCKDKCIRYNCNIEFLTVSSSVNSLSFYKKMGFKETAKEKNENGMRFTPMELVF